jgi:hypothetical protein
LPVASGGTALSSFTADGVVYASSASALTTGSGLQFNGTALTVSASSMSVFLTDTNGGTQTFRFLAKSSTTPLFRIYDQTGGVDLLNIDPSTKDVKVNGGNLVIGTSGKGIDFSATAGTGTSELLADYEEGTWTPSVSSLSGAITSVTSISGTYTKIGRQVNINFLFTITTAGTGASALVIESLPFAVSAANAAAGTGREYFNTGFQMQCVANTTTKIYAQKYDGTYRGSNGDQFTFSMTYST